MFTDVGRTLAAGEATRPPTDEAIGVLLETAPRYGVEIAGSPA